MTPLDEIKFSDENCSFGLSVWGFKPLKVLLDIIDNELFDFAMRQKETSKHDNEPSFSGDV